MKKYPIGLHPGATWRRTDLQIHTPRDPNWADGPHLPGSDDAERAERLAWAKSFVIACRNAGISAISITDHHDMAMVPVVKRAILEEGLEDEIWLFPGMEVTCEDACQALLIFDSETTEHHWERLWGGGLKSIEKPDDKAATAPQALPCGRSIEEFIHHVTEDNILERACIVLPHAGDEGAHKSMLRVGFHVRFRELRCDGFYTERPFSKLKEKTKRIVFGEYADWGSRRRGLIPTSDSRKFGDLGSAPCWIRLGEPTAEAIRQAVLVDEARVAYTEPTIPSQRILEFTVWSTLTGDELRVVLNDGFTAIIGGRGSGKSALLEYLRFGLGRSSLDIDTGGAERTRSQKLLQDTLVNGAVEVRIERDGVAEKWARRLESRDSITITHENGDEESISVETAKERFRARAFEQKELSTILDSGRSAMEQITAIAAADFRDLRKDADARLDQARRGVRTALQGLVDRWRAEFNERQAQGRIEDLKRRIASLRQQLEDKGLSPDDRETLDLAPVYARARLYVDEALTDIDEAQAEASRLRTDFLPGPELPQLGEGDDFQSVRSLSAQIVAARTAIQAHIDEIGGELRDLRAHHTTAAAEFSAKENAFIAVHTEATERQSLHSQSVADQQRLQEELIAAETALRRASRTLLGFAGAEAALSSARQELRDSLAARRSVLESARDATKEVSGGLLKAEVEQAEVPEEYTRALTAVGDGCRIHELDRRVDERARELATAGIDAWDALCDKLIKLYRKRVEGGDSDQVSPEEVASILGSELFEDLTPRQLSELYSRLTEERVVQMLAAVRAEFISFDYKDRDGYISFESASQGQQAAALLQLLLSQEAGTLIIDQPEEDLDSGVVMEIVSLLRTTKQKRQVIFATHNPNFVVNGDADKVIALCPGSRSEPEESAEAGQARVRLLVDGALESEGVADAVTRTMEGGKEAFELRRRKYRFRDDD